MEYNIFTKRIYDEASAEDGYRVLVDRIWPRGISKENAQLDEWMKEIAPSNDLRKWFGHDPKRFQEFKRRYISEIENSIERQKCLHKLKEHYKNENITLLFAAKDEQHNQASILKELIHSKE